MPLFKQARQTQKKLKVFAWGREGTGKTVFALGWPGLAVIDTEHGTDMYAGRVADFDVVHTTSIREVLRAIDEVGKSDQYQTLVIDSITNLYEQLKAEKMKVEDGKANNKISVPDWNAINVIMRDLYRRLTNLTNVHVIVIAAETDKMESDGSGGFKTTGVKADIDKAAGRMFDFSIRFLGKGKAEMIKSRGFDKYPQGAAVSNISFKTFEEFIGIMSEGELPSSDEQPEPEPEVKSTAKEEVVIWECDYFLYDALGNKFIGDDEGHTMPIHDDILLPEIIKQVITDNIETSFTGTGYFVDGGVVKDYQGFKLPRPAEVKLLKVKEGKNVTRTILSIN
jgi:hypothetical protein